MAEITKKAPIFGTFYSKIVIFNGKNDLDNLFKIEYKNRTEYVDLDKIYEILNTYFDSNKIKDLYENKIISLFLNYDTHINQNKDVLLEKYKNNFGIQTIPIINVKGLIELIVTSFLVCIYVFVKPSKILSNQKASELSHDSKSGLEISKRL